MEDSQINWRLTAGEMRDLAGSTGAFRLPSLLLLGLAVVLLPLGFGDTSTILSRDSNHASRILRTVAVVGRV